MAGPRIRVGDGSTRRARLSSVSTTYEAEHGEYEDGNSLEELHRDGGRE